MRYRASGLLLGPLLAVLVASVVHAAVGDHISSEDFDLTGANGDARGIAWDGTYFRVADSYDAKVYTYSSSGSYVSSQNFSLTGANGDANGITWDGTYFRVADSNDNRVYAYSSSGSYVSSFNLTGVNSNANGITWDGTYFRVVDSDDDKVYTYSSSGSYVSSEYFDLAEDNDSSSGITWDGDLFRVVDAGDDKVYAYSPSGSHVSSEDFDLTGANGDARGIAWDGTYLREVDYYTDKAYTYEGLPPGPFTNHGLSGEAEYAALMSSAAATHGDWTCIESSSGEDLRVNNVRLTVHGYCGKEEDGEFSVEVHMATTTSYANLSHFMHVTGPWWFVKSGAAARLDFRIYDDSATAAGLLAFTEVVGGLEDSNRLGFNTVAKEVTDDDCLEASNKTGFACNPANLRAVSPGDEAVLVIGLSTANTVAFADTPSSLESVTVSRNVDYTSATIKWTLYDAVTEYEIERVTAVQVDVSGASRIEYGDPVTFLVAGTQAGIEQYQDTTVQPHRTYQYRVRARGGGLTSWSGWSDYIFSGAKPRVDVPAPGNLELTRDRNSITASWTAPIGDFDDYTLQRQELILAEGSTFFGNVISLGNPWLSGNSTMHTDSNILPNQVYEYRIAAVKANEVGTYSDWFRIGPLNLSLGRAPANLMLLEEGQRIFDKYHEFWLGWDPIGPADSYEVQHVAFDLNTSGQRMKTRIVTDTTYFVTASSRGAIRVRARQLDTSRCAAADDNRCLSEWTAWHHARFAPTVPIKAPAPIDDTADAATVKLRADVEKVIRAATDPLGTTVNPRLVLEFLVLLTALMLAGTTFALSWRRGMAPLGVGMGAAILVLVLFTGYRVLGTSVAWAIAAQLLVAIAGFLAVVKRFVGAR